ncbi:MAG: hypothetical protein C4293_09875 [Nitrospiraceae bacterium]
MMAWQAIQEPVVEQSKGEVFAVPTFDGQCTRCGGYMVAERYIDLLDDTGQLQFMGHRCVQCGEVVDPTILQNRRRSASHAQPPEGLARWVA